jgi:hypothetical protein
VPQDPQNETIDLKTAKCAIQKACAILNDADKIQIARRSIIGWLNQVAFSRHSKKEFNIWWYYEMHTRIQKLLVVAMVLESENLRSFSKDLVVEKTDIPQALIYLKVVLNLIKKLKPKIDKLYLSTVNSLDPEYLNLYLK